MKELTSCELKEVQIEIMKHVHDFCVSHNIKYFICSGTLIGAIRHKGFIPWDDDIDIMLPRNDYERFIELFSKEKGRYMLWSHRIQHDYPYPYAKVTDQSTIKLENLTCRVDLGVDIDVFPIDDLPDDEQLVNRAIQKGKRLLFQRNLKLISLSKNRSFFKNIALVLGRMALSYKSIYKINLELDKNAVQFNGCEGTMSADLVYCIAGNKEIKERDSYAETVLVPFENEEFYAPMGYDKFLRSHYGDYMQLPPIDKQISHHGFKAYWR